MSRIRHAADRAAILLALATGFSFLVSGGETPGHGAGGTGWPVVALLMLVAVVKGWLVVDEFMGLRRVTGVWRWLLRGWLVFVCAAIVAVRSFSAAS